MNWQLLAGRILVVIGLTIIAAVGATLATRFELTTSAQID